jgi:hypothetical protein
MQPTILPHAHHRVLAGDVVEGFGVEAAPEGTGV